MQFEPSRLILARRRKGWKRTELARRAGLKSRSITAYELAERVPSEESLFALAKALEYPPAFFFRPPVERLQEEGVSFRALTKMSANQRERALAAGELALELADWAKEAFELPEIDLPDLHLETSPETAAMTLRAAWGLSDRPIPNMVRLLESKGVRVLSLAEDDRSLDGFSFWRGGEPFVFLNTQKSPERSRFDAAHELGHLVLHRHGHAIGQEVEREAMSFASAFLMPQSSIEAHAPRQPTVPSLTHAKQWWGVSVSALLRRIYDLNIISRWYYRALCIQIQKQGFREKEPEPIDREMSTVWQLIFAKLRDEGVKRAHLAKQLGWPLYELQALVFQLILSAESGGGTAAEKTLPPSQRQPIQLVY